MYIHICIFIYLYMYVHMYIYIYIYVCVYILRAYVCICMYMHECARVCTYAHVCALVSMYIHLWAVVSVCSCVYVCVYLHIVWSHAAKSQSQNRSQRILSCLRTQRARILRASLAQLLHWAQHHMRGNPAYVTSTQRKFEAKVLLLRNRGVVRRWLSVKNEAACTWNNATKQVLGSEDVRERMRER